jgi:hypothetical protein
MLFKDKTVALIGPASHTYTFDQKAYIESFDLVVRINDALPLPGQIRLMTSGRCDVLYIWRTVKATKDWNRLREIRLKTDAPWQDDWAKISHKDYKEKIAFIHPNHFYKLENQLRGVRPNTGLVAISDILSEEPKKLYITGLTFYQGEAAYYPGYVSTVRNEKITRLKGNFAKHKQDPQLNYFTKIFYPKENVECDAVLEKIIKSKKI